MVTSKRYITMIWKFFLLELSRHKICIRMVWFTHASSLANSIIFRYINFAPSWNFMAGMFLRSVPVWILSLKLIKRKFYFDKQQILAELWANMEREFYVIFPSSHFRESKKNLTNGLKRRLENGGKPLHDVIFTT